MHSRCKNNKYLSRCIKLAHQSLLKLDKYRSLLYNEEHEVSEIQQQTAMSKDTSDNKNKSANINTTYKTNKMYTYLGTCWKCNEFGPVAKECKNNPSDTKLTDHQEKP